MSKTTTSTAVKSAPAPSKSFMAVGPTLHYSHPYIHLFWGLLVVVYITACLFWNTIVSGEMISLVAADVIDPGLWNLGRLAAFPLSIYEYPWQIVVLGTLMGILATTPVLVSQLYCFRYSIPFVLSVMFIAKLYFFGVFVALSCLAAACRPLRFRSRFIAIALCMAPQVIYWAVWGGYPTADPLRWGFSYSPWIYAWLTGLFMAGVVLGIGHYTRYRPGLIFVVSVLLLAVTYGIFQKQIGFSELYYQLYVAGNNPEEVVEFHNYSLSQVIDAVIADDALRSYLTGRYYPTDATALRQRLKEEIAQSMTTMQWPPWFEKKMPDRLNYRKRRADLRTGYQTFMDRWPESKRMPIALYFSALLNEYHPDIRYFLQTEILRFYNDYPFKSNILIWQELFDRFPQSPESLEARWRLAWRDAAEGRFERAIELSQVSRTMIREQIERSQWRAQRPAKESIFAAFEPPSSTVMTQRKLTELDLRLRKLLSLIDRENQGPDAASRRRLARFVELNPYALDYETQLNVLQGEIAKDDPLQDNIMLAKALLIFDAHERTAVLSELAQTYPGRDGGIRALYEKALTLLSMWKDSRLDADTRRSLLEDLRATLTDFLESYRNSIYADQITQILNSLPSAP
jgi:hypothetical protein